MNAILHKASSSTEAEARRFAITPSSQRILCVEDDPKLRNLFANLLLNSGYRVEVADDGQTGWEALRHGSYDLLITDNERPRLSGLDLVKRLRSAGQTLPVVMASSSFVNGEADHAECLRVAATLSKPFTPAELLGTVEAVLCAASGIPRRGERFFPVFAEAHAQIRPPSHWGINE